MRPDVAAFSRTPDFDNRLSEPRPKGDRPMSTMRKMTLSVEVSDEIIDDIRIASHPVIEIPLDKIFVNGFGKKIVACAIQKVQHKASLVLELEKGKNA